MMKWITGITLNNYRAFVKSEIIDIPQDQHLLIYGENGSGKSSVYNALKDFFNSSFTSSNTIFNLNEFEKASGNTTGFITLKIAAKDAQGNLSEADYTFSEPLSNVTHQQPLIQLANKVKGFLDYKKLLKVHALDISTDQHPNMFDLIVKSLLGEHRVANPSGGTTTVELLEEYCRIAAILLINPSHTNKYKVAEDELNKLNAELNALLKKVFIEANKFLDQYFKNKITLDFRYSNLRIHKPNKSSKRQMFEELYLRVFYAGREIEYYQTFLNEARLSALAICLYLASIKTNSVSASELRVLFLDDIFIGLDTSNRMPLLEVLRDEFIIDGFQIFISTYDRQWFELARQWFDNNNCKFKTLEMYIDDDGNPNTPEKPVIIDRSSDHFEKAKKYFDAKDYPASANYLRKACEAELRRILPQNKTLITHHDSGVVKKIDKLGTLIDNFFEYAANNGLDCAPFSQFKTYKKIIFNPLSHDDLEAPHYRIEIQAGIDLVRCLRQIKSKEIITVTENTNKPMRLELSDNVTGTIHNYEIYIHENLRLLQQNTDPLKLSSVECHIIVSGTERQFPSLQAAFDQIRAERSYPVQANYDDFYQNIRITNSKRFSDYMIF